MQKNMRLALPISRFDDRKGLLQSLDGLKSELDSTGVLDGVGKFREQAYDMLIRELAKAFDVTKRPADMTHLNTSAVSSQIRRMGKVAVTGIKRMLARSTPSTVSPRRLCEAGAGFVTVTTQRLGYACGWQ